MVGYDDDDNALTLGDDDALSVGDYELAYNSTDNEWQARHTRPTGGDVGAHGEVFGQTFIADSAIGEYALAFNRSRVVRTYESYTTADITLSVWVKTTATGLNQRLLSQQEHPITNTGDHDFFLRIGTGDTAEANINKNNTSGTSVTGTTLVNDGNWHHVALTVSADTLTLYVDGAQEDSTTGNPTGNFAGIIPMLLGGLSDGKEIVDGAIDDARVFNKALTSTQISDLSNKVDVTDGLVARYDFEFPETPSVAIDSTGEVYPKNRVPRSTSGSLVPQGLAESVSAGEALADDGNTYTSVQTAVDNASGWVFVGPGTFNESVTITTSGLTLEGCGYDTHIVGGNSNAVNSNATNVTIRNLSASTTAGGTNPYSAFQANSSGAKYINCWARESDQHGFFIREASDAKIINCRVVGTVDDHGINVDDASVADSAVRVMVSNCSIESGVSGDGIRIDSGDGIVSNCTLSGVGSGAGNHGIRVSGAGHDGIYIGNRVINTADNGIHTNTSSVGNIIANNRISDSGGVDLNDTGTNTTDANLTGLSN